MATDADEAPLLADEPLTVGRFPSGAFLAGSLLDFVGVACSAQEAAAGSDCKVSKIYGVAGMIRLLAGHSNGTGKVSHSRSNFLMNEIFLRLSVCFHLSTASLFFKNISGNQKRDEAYFMSLLRIAETTCGLYYSYDRDLTLNLQRASKLAAGRVHKPLWKQADPRFVWNRNLLEELIETKGQECGEGVQIWKVPPPILSRQNSWLSMKVRGSIPLLWEQIVDLSYKPRPSIIEHEEMTKVVERHFHDLSQRYGDTMVIDLTDKQGDEGNLSNAFAAEMQNFPDIRYVHFDFHHICGGGNFDNLQVLYDEIEEAIQKQGIYEWSFLARKSLDSQLRRMGALSSAESISQSDSINDKFKKLWVEHGDELSLEYAGSYALKGDLVRYGRQTLPGLIKDGMSALSRYYLNNFHDGVRQDALDLISGYYTVSKSSSSPFQIIGFESAPMAFATLPILQPTTIVSINHAIESDISFAFAGKKYLPVASAIIVGGITVTTFTLSQEPEVEQPRMRSTQEILTKYKFNGDAAAAAAHAKDKLMERQEKLAKMVEESAEFESEAKNFATLGQQIRKSLETKRWWWPS
ncbi:Phosphatidylinositide phosphatase SAC1 [Triticum urartu]|uniref:Phosphatidylinositide phosphatase SAC1 n=1 Tax=Triticum urartu TaxID=4572 RepID=M8ASN1_TRIUA|nr:Phosphatidylinositide phosphatase SAC1 [Triticum urartu]